MIDQSKNVQQNKGAVIRNQVIEGNLISLHALIWLCGVNMGTKACGR